MYVKKIILDDVRLGYSGAFSIKEFFEAVEDWKEKNGFDKEIKRHLEHAEPDGRKIEWFVELWKDERDFARIVIRFKALFDKLTEVEIKKDNRRVKLSKGEVLTLIDGILVQDVYGRWQQKPMFYFLRTIVDKYIYRFHKYQFEAEVEQYVHDLHKHLKLFFESQKKGGAGVVDVIHRSASAVPPSGQVPDGEYYGG